MRNIVSMVRDKINMLKARLTILSLLRTKKFSSTSIMNHKHEDFEGHQNKPTVQYLQAPQSQQNVQYQYYCNDHENGDMDKYPDMRHCLSDEEDDRDELDLGDPNGSVIDLVRNSKEKGEDFKLEDEIDHVADLFILKFHKRMKLQKLESFKRYQEMLQQGV